MSQPPDQEQPPQFNHGEIHEDQEDFEPGVGVEVDAEGNPIWDENAQPPEDLENNEPLASAEKAHQIAGAALQFCDDNQMDLNGKRYLKFEAWQAIARLDGVRISKGVVKDNVLGGVPGITATALLKNDAGKVLGEGEGFVGQDEPFWASKPVSDRINMAQTRACGRVIRLNYSFIVQIMNKQYGRHFEMTPAEEMFISQKQNNQPPAAPPQPGQRAPMPQQPQPTQWAAGWQQPPRAQVQPNVQQPLGGAETWQGQLLEARGGKFYDNKYGGKSQMFIISLVDGHNGSTYDKTIFAHAQMLVGRNVEIIAVPRKDGSGKYNIQQIRPL